MASGGDLAGAQTDWINRMIEQAGELVPEKSRTTWRSMTMKLRKTPGTGVQMSMRIRNAMGIERVIHDPNPTAVQAAKELHAIFTGFGQHHWEVIEIRFGQTPDPADETKSTVNCKIFVDPEKTQKI